MPTQKNALSEKILFIVEIENTKVGRSRRQHAVSLNTSVPYGKNNTQDNKRKTSTRAQKLRQTHAHTAQYIVSRSATAHKTLLLE